MQFILKQGMIDMFNELEYEYDLLKEKIKDFEKKNKKLRKQINELNQS